MNHLEEWSRSESLLQSYRQIFVSSQAVFIAAGAFLVGTSDLLLLVTAILGWLMIWFIWFPVVRARHLIVDYHKHLALGRDASGICSEREYVQDRDKRRSANRILGVSKNMRPTRFKIDVLLPALYSLVWGMLVIHQLTI